MPHLLAVSLRFPDELELLNQFIVRSLCSQHYETSSSLSHLQFFLAVSILLSCCEHRLQLENLILGKTNEKMKMTQKLR